MSTRKHQNNYKKAPKNAKKYECICGKVFTHRQGLYTHHKKCKMGLSVSETIYDNNNKDDNKDNKNEEKIDNKTNKELKEIIKDLIKQNGDLMKIINEIMPKIGNVTNNNNNFNLNVFLNEHCKDAQNLSEFIDSLKITMDDLVMRTD